MINSNEEINIAMVDDHTIFRVAMVDFVGSLQEDFHVVFDGANGKELLTYLEQNTLPDIILMDLEMPVMNGLDTAKRIAELKLDIPILFLTMNSNENMLIQALKSGAKGYLGKDIQARELRTAINSVIKNGYYYTDVLTGNLIRAMKTGSDEPTLSAQELRVLEYCCTELTYKEVASEMNLSPKTIDVYRSNLFEKTGAKSRVGLVLYAFKNGFVKP